MIISFFKGFDKNLFYPQPSFDKEVNFSMKGRKGTVNAFIAGDEAIFATKRGGCLHYVTFHLAFLPPSIWQKILRLPCGILKCHTDIPSREIEEVSGHNCLTCIEGKATRKPFHSSSSSSPHPPFLLLSDIRGHKKVANHNGARYFVTLIDDYSRFATVALVKTK